MDNAQLQKLYERYGYLVHRRCAALLKSRTDADDALQEVFARIQRYGRGANETNDLAWLYRIAANCCFDLMKSKGRERPASDAKLEKAQGSPTDADRRAVLGAVLAQLDDETREIGIAHYLGGFTQEEVAERTGFSRKTIGRRLGLFEETFTRLWTAAQGAMS